MSEPVAKERPIVDLDDFERRLRQRDHDQEDPLAELARLVGETSDPYGDVFAQEAMAYPAAAQQPAASRVATESESTPVSPRLSGDFAAIEAGLRGAAPAHGDPDPYDAGHEYYAQHDHYLQRDQYPQHDQYAGDERYTGEGRDHDGQHWPDAAQQNPPPSASPSRKPIYAMIATIALGVIGVGVAFAYKGSGSSPAEIKTIEAASGPNKIQPPVDTASDQSAQNSGGQQQTPTRLVNGEEQPVDISQSVQQNASRNPDVGQGDASSVPVPSVPGQLETANNPSSSTSSPSEPKSADQTSSFGLSGMPTPKKVKVVSVRPDGTILSNDQPPPAALPDPIAALSATPEPADAPRSSTPKTATPKSTSRVATTPKSTQLAKADDIGDTPTPKPAHKAKPKRVAAVEPAATTTDTASTPADADASKAAGGFAVQLAAPGSEAEAQTASSRLAKKFADALDGRRLGVHKAQSNGKSVFRVRVSSLSKEDAVSLCEKLKANGGSCFVAKN